MEVNLEWYRVFYEAAKTGSLTGAAERLHITQPAVSHTLKQLEATLGAALFFRTTKGVRLTAEGEALFGYVQQALGMVEAGERTVADMRQLTRGEVHIGASDTLCKHYLLPYLEKFHRDYPEIRIHVTNRTTPETIALLKEGAIDFGIVNMPAADPKVDFRGSAPIQDILVGRPDDDAVAQAPLSLERLASYPLLMLESGGSTRRFLDDFALRRGVRLRPDFELGSIDLLAQFASGGFGLAFVPRQYVEAELRDGRLVEIAIDPPLPERRVGIATLRGVPPSTAAKRLLGLLP
ncbi:LysR family transcriptional regulator [Paenibacillus antri]|uniref:LysR family transcriptional regulator n=1 Tax=Paenibacillus antri TaxID=2582848 RepID=A0A5R9G5M6_9BACL|nr:LysR family transcriptional regulator [Paenibacillus antri]TLS49626.1 LysR family transcriptional regulator [Paenibacillus antri]